MFGVTAFSTVHVGEDSLQEVGTLASAVTIAPGLSKRSGLFGGGFGIGNNTVGDDILEEFLDVSGAGKSGLGLSWK